MTLPLVVFPNPILKQESKPVTEVNDDTRKFLHNLLETMYQNEGIGLAAVQTGNLIRALVMDIGDISPDSKFEDVGNQYKRKNSDKQTPIFMINPEIIAKSEESSIYNEGCLSFPGVRAEITRPKQVTIKYLDYMGKEKILKADELLATCAQHEIDHLRGTSFVDYLSKLKRDRIIQKMKKLAKQDENNV